MSILTIEKAMMKKKYEQQIEAGIAVEMEHTDDPEEAKKIAMDHIEEDPEYYTKLAEAGLVDEPKAREMLPIRLEKSEWKSHKYIKKVGNKYFYTEDEIRNFKLTKKSDGFYYMDDMKITNNPEKARQFEEKVKEHKEADNAVKIGDKVQIKGTHKGSFGRGIVAVVKEMEEGAARVMDAAGRMFRVPTSALVFAKSITMVVRLEKAIDKSNLHKVVRYISRNGKYFKMTYWVRAINIPIFDIGLEKEKVSRIIDRSKIKTKNSDIESGGIITKHGDVVVVDGNKFSISWIGKEDALNNAKYMFHTHTTGNPMSIADIVVAVNYKISVSQIVNSENEKHTLKIKKAISINELEKKYNELCKAVSDKIDYKGLGISAYEYKNMVYTEVNKKLAEWMGGSYDVS